MNTISLESFKKIGKPFSKNLSLIVTSMMRCCSSNSTKVALEMQKATRLSFKSNEIRFARFLQYAKFQVSDGLWRIYIKLLFGLMKERNAVKSGSKIHLYVDFTTLNDDFLILYASVAIGSRTVPLYFTMRRYPRVKDQLDQKKMELAFMQGLSHVLSKKYRYVIVADQGFGNGRFVSLCKNNEFHYLIRIDSNKNIRYKNKDRKLSSFKRSKTDLKSAYIYAWDSTERIIVKRKGKALWWIVTDLKGRTTPLQIADMYAKRFKIEKMFQDQKSSGFDIEDTKIRKYDRFKRLLFCVCLSQLLLVFLGDVINNEKHSIKKNFPFHANLILASFSSDVAPWLHSSDNVATL